MRNHLIAAAMLSAMGQTFAQTSILPAGVTVYGNFDIGVRYDSGAKGTDNASSAVRFDDGQWTTSRLGVRAERSITDDLTAIGEIQGTIDADGDGTGTSTSFSFDRLAIVGLRSKSWGYLNLGNEYTPMHRHVIRFNAGAYDGYAGANNASGLLRIATRRAHQLNYRSPQFSGFAADIQVAQGEKTVKTSGGQEGNAVGVFLSFDGGPLQLGITAEKQKSTVGIEDFEAKSIGGSYDFKVAKVFFVTGTKKGGVAATNADYDLMASTLGVRVPIGTGDLAVSVGSVNSRGVANADATTWGVNYLYPFADRVNLYLMAGQLKNKNGATRVLKGGSGASGLFTSANANTGTGSNTLNSVGTGINFYF